MSGPNHAMRALREARGLTRIGLAERAGVHRLTIQRLEEGANPPRVSTLERIAKALGVEDVAALLPAPGTKKAVTP